VRYLVKGGGVASVATDLASSATGRGDTRTSWQADFRRLWAAQSVALFGAEVTTLALPLTAALALGASLLQMGLLVAAGELPFLLCSLPLGVVVDRVRRRPLVIAADLGRALLLALIPLAALLGMLRMEMLYAVAFLVGALSVLFDVAQYAFIPSLIPREQLYAVNGRIQVSHSASETAGPGLAGILIQWVTAPLAIAATAITFLVSALLVGTVQQRETTRASQQGLPGFRHEVAEGLRALLDHPLLRPIVIASATAGLFTYAVRAVYILFATRELGLDAFQLGVVIAAGGVAAVPGGLLAEWATRRFSFGPSVWGGWLIAGASLLLIPLATGATAVPTLIAAQALGGLAYTVANVNQWSLRQAVTPDHLQGRVTASHRFLVYGVFPLGALLGGTMATALGMRPALLIGAIGATLCPLWLLATPLRGLREAPRGASGEEAEGV
jgi:MFS family permease